MQTEKPSFYWHDYETWGLSPSRDRPSQFAGVRTDMDFNIINEPEMFYCRLSDDYLPNPEAAIVTGITPKITQSEGLPEYKFAQRINHQFTQDNTCVVGYNNIRFDDEFTRNLFYRNFYDPYEYSWKNGNSRWDIIDLLRATYALRPDGIIWPTNEQGVPSFRLELLTEANGISHEQAHDARSDVYATIALAKLIKDKSPKLFNYYFNLRNKNKVKTLINVNRMTPLVHVTGMFGSARGNIALVSPIVWHPTNINAVVIVDLTQDITPLIELTADEIRDCLYTKRDELGGKAPIPLKLIHINKCPFISVEKTLLPKNLERLKIDYPLCLKNLEILRAHNRLQNVVSEVFEQEKTFDNKGNVDNMLYDGFFSYDDKRVFEKIHKSSPEELATSGLKSADKRFKELFFRYRARNFPDTLSSNEQDQWNKYVQLTLKDLDKDYVLNLDSFAEQYKDDQSKIEIINSLYEYAKKITV